MLRLISAIRIEAALLTGSLSLSVFLTVFQSRSSRISPNGSCACVMHAIPPYTPFHSPLQV